MFTFVRRGDIITDCAIFFRHKFLTSLPSLVCPWYTLFYVYLSTVISCDWSIFAMFHYTGFTIILPKKNQIHFHQFKTVQRDMSTLLSQKALKKLNYTWKKCDLDCPRNFSFHLDCAYGELCFLISKNLSKAARVLDSLLYRNTLYSLWAFLIVKWKFII